MARNLPSGHTDPGGKRNRMTPAKMPPKSSAFDQGTDAWLSLRPGDHVRVTSKSGNDYEATIVYAGMDDAGVRCRTAAGRQRENLVLAASA